MTQAPQPCRKKDRDEVFVEFTKSICPLCKTPVDAQVNIRAGKVYLRRRCREHGEFEALVYGDAEEYLYPARFNRPGTIALTCRTEVKDGCPSDCGLCPEHKQHACLGIIEVNTGCNLDCPICFADSGHQPDGYSITHEQCERMLDAFVESGGEPEVVMFSVGEPTIHQRILDFIDLAQDRPIKSVNLTLAGPAWGTAPPPWAPGRREETHHMSHAASDDDAERTWCLAEVDIFCDLSEQEMEAIAQAAPMKTYHAGEILYSPTQPSEVLFILKKGRVRVFRVSADGRALTTAIISPGTIFGEMVLLGQHMYDNYAEALDDTVVCVMSRTDVNRPLLSDARIAALVGTSRETCTKVLRDFADHGLLRLARGRITVLDPERLKDAAG